MKSHIPKIANVLQMGENALKLIQSNAPKPTNEQQCAIINAGANLENYDTKPIIKK